MVSPQSQPSSTSFIYNTVVIDPPWNERGAGKYKRGADKHYEVMKTPDILRVILQCPHWNQLHENTHLYLWTTNSFLPQGLWLMEALNFRYVSNFCWGKFKDAKVQTGIGQFFRGSHELCLLGAYRKGKRSTQHRTEAKNISSLLLAERNKHSCKPKESYQLIESRSEGPYLELFARTKRPNWTSWGNEV